MQPPPEVERFNEEIVYDTTSRRPTKNITKQELDYITNKASVVDKRSTTAVSKSRKSLSEVKRYATEIAKQRKTEYQSTVKTGDILKMINNVNFL